jgi:hypothetical protein
VIDTAIKFEGKSSFRITRSEEQAFGLVGQGVNIPAGIRSKKVELSATLKSKDTTEDGWLLFANTNSRLGILEQYRSDALVGTHDWRRVSVIIPLSNEVSDIKFGAMLLGGGVGWVDDVRLRIIE